MSTRNGLRIFGTILAILTGVLFCSAPAHAQDDAFGGFYVGVVGGYASGSLTSDLTDEIDHEPSGGMFGGKAGFNYVAGALAVGFEGDLAWTSIGGDDTITVLDFRSDVESDVTLLSTIRGRVGGVFGRAMIYGTGGVAIAQMDSTITVTYRGTRVGSASNESTHLGWTLGAGAEFALSDRLSISGEYLRVDFSKEEIVMDIDHFVQTDKGNLDLNTIRFGLNILF